ncbi:L,D-transpeptidase family protein [Microbulbifer hydrolyticus]|uniref:Outer membrane biosynthesis protein TonB n=2 Tax=Microbulbifer hydrolyticus TaxID=48074 RepID=A0AA89T599_9GAMM|nr:L,D-transpeptidase family protein [Microbulbifer hydrolyticus]MBB5211165.1 outer membrane biosynthesis protein TonB [Microbulbifer hydrolyticus]
MSSKFIAKQDCQRTSSHHFYAIVAISCCALLPLSDYTEADDAAPPQTEQQIEQEQQAPAESQSTADAETATEPSDEQADTPAESTENPVAEPEESATANADKQESDREQNNEEPPADTEVAEAGSKENPESEREPAEKAENSVTGNTAANEEPSSTAQTAQTTTEASPEAPDEGYTGPDSAVDFATAGSSLRKQAEHYRRMMAQWHPIAPGEPLRAGDQGPRIAQLRKLLQMFGDYNGHPGPVTANNNNPERFDAGLQLAVESYQRRHGMAVTGVADKATLKELERPPVDLARQLEVNAKRWDKLPDKPGKRYILVNVPDFRLHLIEQHRVVLSMKTVVGKSSKRTPDMTSKVVSVVFNPTWTVPRSILLTDLLPKARNNPEAMHRRGYRVVKYGTNTTTPISDKSIQSAARGKATLRQISGPGNTLGRVKFIVPNKQAIFLHDTQAQSLFEHHHRAFSHGCIRLQQPEELAYALLGPQGWDRTRVAQATTGDESITIKVANPPKLFIAYFTAWVDGLGKVHFRPDIYHRDN